jgi:hypothetical protein
VQADDNYFYHHYPRQFLARFEGTHPAVMARRIESCPEENRLDLLRCRQKLSLAERKRLLETYLYSRFGLPRLSRNRFKLRGALARKARPELGAFSGTLKP